MKRCMDHTTLERFAAGTLAESEMPSAQAHLEKCRRCSEALDRLPLDRELLEAVRDAKDAREELAPDLARLSQLAASITTTLLGHA